MLDEFQVVLHSADSIAPVGVLHPLAFHLEYKAGSASLSGRRETENSIQEKTGLVFEVQGECPQNSEAMCLPVAEVTDSVEVTDNRLNISRRKKDNAFSICCWLQETQKTSAGKHN